MKLKSKIAAALAVFALASTAHAALINGTIGFAGEFTEVTGPPAVLTFQDAKVLVGLGDYAGTAGETFTDAGEYFGDLQVDPLIAPQDLWSFSKDSITYSFKITNAMVSADGDKFSGSGLASITGFQDTPGIWEVTKNIGFTFSAGNVVSQRVPDGGTTLAMLGISFLGLGGVSRLLRRK